MMWLALLKRFWPLLAGVLLLVAVYAWHVSEVRQARRAGYEQAHHEFTAQLERERQLWRQIEQETRDGYQSEIDQLRKSAARERRGPAIRCVLDDKSKVRIAGDSGGIASSSADGHAVRADVDLRPEIVRVGETCEQLRQQLIAIKSWQDKVR
jgi:hypothetical protein